MNRMKDFLGSTRTRVVLGATGLLVVGAILGAVLATAIPALAAGHGGNATNNTLVPGATTPGTANAYCTLYEQTLASSLGVPVSKLESANVSAIDTVLAQLVKDGKLTQAQADRFKQKVAANGTNLCSHIGQFVGKHHRGGFGAYGVELRQIRQDVQSAVAKKLGYADAAHLQTALAGTDIVALAKTKNVDQATLNATVTSTVKADLDKLVSNKTISSDQETQVLTMLGRLLSAGRYGVFGLGHMGFGK